MISTNNFRTGLTIDIEEGLCTVIEFFACKTRERKRFCSDQAEEYRNGSCF